MFLAALMVLSVFAMSAAFAGGAAAEDTDDFDEYYEDLDELSEEGVLVGQEIAIGGFDDADGAEIREGFADSDGDTVDTSSVETIEVDGENVDVVTFETDDLEDGDAYHVYVHGEYLNDEDELETNLEATFWASDDVIDVEFDDDSVELNDDSDEATTDLIVDTDREEVDVYVSGELGNESVDDDDLEAIFGDDLDADDNEVLIEGVDSDIEANFSDQSSGDYEFTVDVADTTAEDTAEITVGEAPEIDAQFSDSTYEQNVGDVAEFEIEHSGTDDLTVEMTDEEEFYNATIEIEGVENEDNVTVQYNTYLAGQDNGDDVVTVLDDEGDELAVEDVTVTEELDGDEGDTLDEGERLLHGDYELEVIPAIADDEGEFDEEETDAAVLLLEERSTGDMNTWALAGDEFDADDVELDDIEDSATSTDSVADEDLLVVGVEASGIYGYAFDDDGQWADEGDLNLTFEDTDEPRYGSADDFSLEEGDEVIVDEDENRFFVVVDATEDEMDVDETWDITFTVGDDNDYVDDDETADAQINIEEAYVELVGDQDEDDRFQIEADNESELTAETNLAPSTDGDFRLRTTSEVYTADAEVDGDGMLMTTFDLSEHEEGDEIRTLRVTAGEEPEHEAEGVFVSADDDTDKKDGFKIDADAPSEVNVDDDASLDVTVVNNNDEAGNATLEATVGDEEYTEELELDAGDSVTESFDFDTSEEAEIDWSVETGDDSDSGTLTVGDKEKANGENGENGANGENGENGANGENGENGANGDDANGADDSSADDDETVPGFGVAVAIVALLGAAMLALRRQN
ncbi:BGTF surface domain-containing protein [Natronococcus sp. A-GB7]|uniref:BGTF surface domain-containing protein n=1 Tax=Natronococcus sp. A-GB7 TaxID=3037649 RepID=UPI00241E1313|nr:BGTF surface domain-containing protein [Natronococcus sp. A-GB7]MDG5821489.1 PGF-CTERM sorting domain-containing protein [Natronococcus sp. A-GB7]